MSKLLQLAAGLKAVLFLACAAFARGEILPVILISLLFNLAHLSAKPPTSPRDTIVILSDHNDRAGMP
jgi:chemotaxis signal transduction protein